MTPPSETLDATQVRRSVAALAEHLQRMGVGFFPQPSPDAVAEWESAFEAASEAETQRTLVDNAETTAKSSPDAPLVLPSTTAAAPEASADPAELQKPGTSTVPGTRSGTPSGTVNPSETGVREISEPYVGGMLGPEDRLPVLDSLSQTVAGCTRCPVLAGCRTQTVFGEGSPTARFAFFGEGPGSDEDQTGRPFVGKAGQLLTKMIQACTLSREEVYIFNTVKCRPPGNRNPEPDEIANCREYFEKQLDVIRPEYIICLGAVSMKALLGTTLSVGRMRGKLHDYRDSKVLVTYHPAYLLRTPAAKKAAWEDLQFLMADAGIDLSANK